MSATRPAAESVPKPPTNVAEMARRAIEGSLLFNTDESPFTAAIDAGKSKLVVVTGDNASGKSLFVQVIGVVGRRHGMTPVSVSIRERTNSSPSDVGGFRRAAMFGAEHEQSTGATSVKAVQDALTKNLTRKNGSLLILDEPEMGLAESYSRAFGEFIARSAGEVPRRCRGVVIVTHSRPLVEGLLAGCGRGLPTHVAIAADEASEPGLRHWIDHPRSHTVEDLLHLHKTGLDRWRQVDAVLQKAREE